MYKIGRTTNLKRRMTQYQSSHANNIDILFIYKCKNLKLVERCIKSLAVNYQYRSYKEIYEININILKKITKYCDMLTQYFKKSKLSTSDTPNVTELFEYVAVGTPTTRPLVGISVTPLGSDPDTI